MIYYDIDKKPLTRQSFNNDAPIGALSYWAFKKIPDGWLICDGKRVPKAAYPELFEAIGDVYGQSDSDTFVLPDARERYLDAVTYNDGNPEVGYREESAQNITGNWGPFNQWQPNGDNFGAFYNYWSGTREGYGSGTGQWWRHRIGVDFARDAQFGDFYNHNDLKVPWKNIFIIIKALNKTDERKLLDKVELVYDI